MRHIKAVETLQQNALFDSATLDSCSWWATDLNDRARRALDEGWQGIFRGSLLKLMPAEQLGTHFDATFGRPTKELHSMAALVFIMEFKNWTIEEAVEQYTFNNSIHFALNLSNRHNYLCTRTLEEYRRLIREDELAASSFMAVTQTLVEALNINIKTQRLDSTHILSDMAIFGRTKLLGVAVRQLLHALKRHTPELYASLPGEFTERYTVTLARLFGESLGNQEKRRATTQLVAQDMHYLIERFADEPQVNERTSYKALVRMFGEHCEVKEQQISVRPKSLDENGQSTHTLQNPSDWSAGYDRVKGPGQKVQLAQSSAPENPVQLITACLPQSAGDHDADALTPMVGQLKANHLAPDKLTADTHYGSDENHQHAKGQGIELISPVAGRAPHSAKPTEVPDKQAPPKKHGRRQRHTVTAAEEREARLSQRREEQESEPWRSDYRRRAGIEGTNRGLDRRTGIKRLRVRGVKAVAHSVYGKVMGWNIIQGGRAVKKAAQKARKAAQKAIIHWLSKIEGGGEILSACVLASIARLAAVQQGGYHSGHQTSTCPNN